MLCVDRYSTNVDLLNPLGHSVRTINHIPGRLLSVFSNLT